MRLMLKTKFIIKRDFFFLLLIEEIIYQTLFIHILVLQCFRVILSLRLTNSPTTSALDFLSEYCPVCSSITSLSFDKYLISNGLE